MTSIFRAIALQLSKALLKLAIDRALRKELPNVFATLDRQLPNMLADKAGPLDVQAAVVEAVEEKLGHIATRTQIGAVLGLYDPIQSAIRNFE